MTSTIAQQSEKNPVNTWAEGRPSDDPTTTLQIRSKVGGGGLALLQDTQLIETLAHFSRERIPERVVHAKAAGAWGEFEVTHDISDITSAKFLAMGKKTKVLARISTVAGEKSSSDTVRDIRGWALKHFTEEGNQDLVFNDLIAQATSLDKCARCYHVLGLLQPQLRRSKDSLGRTAIHCPMHLFGLRGVPASLRNINAYGNHTYKLGKPDGTFKYVKWVYKPDAGIENLTAKEAVRLAGEDPDYHVNDLYNAIEKGDYPTWTLYIQVMDPKEAETYRWNIFDMTKIWPHHDYPLIPVGKLTLNKNPDNYFQDIEQAAFSPSTMVPGVAPSADIMLQAPTSMQRSLEQGLFSLPRDWPATMNGNYGGDPDYVQSSFRPLAHGPKDVAHDEWVGKVQAYSSDVEEDDLVQAIRGRVSFRYTSKCDVFAKVDEDLARKIEEKLKA
ncbi:hypothetical protein MMC18_005138 [Xylographa bjoerkii]|nr:hypothetical protein [Xylographa bjoerkii]